MTDEYFIPLNIQPEELPLPKSITGVTDAMNKPFSNPRPAVECVRRETPEKPIYVRHPVTNAVYVFTQEGYFGQGFWEDVDTGEKFDQVTGIPSNS